MWLIIGELDMKAGWRDASLALWGFSQSNKNCIHLLTAKTICFSCHGFAMSAFASMEVSNSNK